MTDQAALQDRTFPARCTGVGPDPLTRAWITARFNGFLQDVPPPERCAHMAAAWQDEGRTLHAVYDRADRPAGALSGEVPVATLATIDGTLDAGGDEAIPCTLIADVTVSATYRGRGLMRRLMQRVAADATASGVPVLALHAAHPALYARFGFAPATRSVSVELECARFGLRSAPAGRVHEADPRQGDDLARAVGASAGPLRFGALAVRRPATPDPHDGHRAQRCLVHTDAQGRVDGVLTYAFQGWTPQAQVLEVLSETYSTLEAHAALWQTICATGIASTVRATDVRPDDALPWLLTDRAAWRVTGLTDGFSLRILDPASVLALRGYAGPDGDVAIEVTDETGPASGTWRVRVSGGRAAVEATHGPADVRMDVLGLSACFLAATRTTTLVSAGRVTASGGGADRLDALLRWPVDAASTLHF